MKGALSALFLLVGLAGCGGGKQKNEEEKGGETFERMVILEEAPSDSNSQETKMR